MANLNTIIAYSGDGSTTDFTVPFDYLKKSFVKVIVDTTTLEGGAYGDNSKDYYFLSSTVVRLKVAPEAGLDVIIKRFTSATDRVVSFKDASILKAKDLDASGLQALHIAEEGRDVVSEALFSNEDRNWDAKNRRIVRVANPVDDTDAINYQVYKDESQGAYQARLVAEEKAREAGTYANDANVDAGKAFASERNAYNHALSASQSAQSSSQSASSASSSATSAATSAQGAAESLGNLQDSEINTKTSEVNARASELNAKDSELAAKVSETNAKDSEDNADTAEVNSSGSAAGASGSELNAWNSEQAARQSELNASAFKVAAEAAKVSAESSAQVALGAATDVLGKVQADWTEADSNKTSYIKNKPTNLVTAESLTTAISGVNTSINTLSENLTTTNTNLSNLNTTVGNMGTTLETLGSSKFSTDGGIISGNLTVTGAIKGGSLQATSDARLKENIEDYSVDISSLNTYRYNLKSDGSKRVGLIAQEVQKVIPEAVDTDREGHLSLDYNAIVAVLVDKINKLEKKVYGN